MKLADLIGALDRSVVHGSSEIEVTGLSYNSRSIKPGMMFVALRGLHADGHRFVRHAVDQGAVAIVIQNDWPFEEGKLGTRGVQADPCIVRVPDTRKALSALASQFYGRPSHRLGVIGVTGTNGKTTTTHLIKKIFEMAGKRVGLLGTVGYYMGPDVLPAKHTTPESLELQELLARMVKIGMDYVVMEVSSHALALERVADCAFDVAVFTNLSQDHLDFHKDMEDYFGAKLKLFSTLGAGNPKAYPRMAVVNREDPYSSRVIAATRCASWSYGASGGEDLSAEEVRTDLGGIRLTAVTPKGKFEIQSALLGGYNVLNILAAVGAALSQEIPIPAIQKGIQETRQVPGRFEKVDDGQKFLVVVDYAHTEEALRQLLLSVRGLLASPSHAGSRVLTVFGCGGDRDRGKRPKMGRVAAELSDCVILTSDNPRTEEPEKIIKEIESGVHEVRGSGVRPLDYSIIPDRAEAIGKAVTLARSGDVVVIAGKGHENDQIIGTQRFPFDDREVARLAIRRVMARG